MSGYLSLFGGGFEMRKVWACMKREERLCFSHCGGVASYS